MRILYGVAGEGMGHATRSHAFLADLVGDHDVLVVASGRAHDYLAQHFPDVREILGFSLAYEDNPIRRRHTHEAAFDERDRAPITPPPDQAPPSSGPVGHE